MDLVTLPDVSGADEYLRCARRIDVNGSRVRGGVRCVGPLRGEVQGVLPRGGVAVRRGHEAIGAEGPIVRGSVAPGERPVVIARVCSGGKGDLPGERNGLARLNARVGAHVDLRRAPLRRGTAAAPLPCLPPPPPRPPRPPPAPALASLR